MTTKELQELTDWSARKMEYYTDPDANAVWVTSEHTRLFKDSWHPDTDLNQCFMLVEKMREEGWYLTLEYLTTGLIKAGFICKKPLPNHPQRVLEYDIEQCLAILKAAKATEAAHLKEAAGKL